MSSAGSSTTLALKAAFIAAILAVLVLPSIGRCPSLGPQVAPTPAPAPAVRCSDCDQRCSTTCLANGVLACKNDCELSGFKCRDCWDMQLVVCLRPCKSDCRAAACVSH
ncbi:hypothetical protein ZWY2020_019432 [Hordeum vulgare]|nr:hypothetical protein ZWY2020_019432 [Hordeum vulgare]